MKLNLSRCLKYNLIKVIADTVKVHFKTLPEALEGCTIHTDGTSTKQSGEVHKYSIKRYV